jgi:Ran GTPase-activating protein (RanGAP) involved in mRNA processing and transport
MLSVSVVSLSLNGNPIGDQGGIAFGTMLKGNNTLVSLDLGSCGLNTKALVSIAQSLHAHPALAALVLDRPAMKGPHDIQCVMQHLTKNIAANSCLVHLSMNHFDLYDDHLLTLLPALVQNSSITSLSLRGNKLGSDGGKALAKLMARRPDLARLDIVGNRINDGGAIDLASVLRSHPGLQELLLNANGIGEVGLIALADGIAESQSLRKVTLWGNRFSDEAVSAFYQYRDRLASLYVDFELYVVDGLPMVAQRN